MFVILALPFDRAGTFTRRIICINHRKGGHIKQSVTDVKIE